MNTTPIDTPIQRTARMIWTHKEEDLLRAAADLAWEEGMTKKDLASRVKTNLPHRSMEAIKKRLINIQWTPPAGPRTTILPPPLQPTPAANATKPTPSPPTPAVPDLYDQWRRRMLTTILNDLREPITQATALRETALSLLNNRISTSETAVAVEEQVNMIFPLMWLRKEPRPAKEHRLEKPKELRRHEYASIQRLLNTNRKDAATAVLEGSWRIPSQGETREPPGLYDAWGVILGKEGPPPNYKRLATGAKYWDIMEPISEKELRESLKTLTNSAAGMDKQSASSLLTWHLPSLASLLNLFLVTESLPSTLAHARITLIPKTPSPEDHNDYRPLAITSILTRAMHKILARRMRDLLAFSATQYAFLQRDGCLEATTVLHAVLRNCHELERPIALAFLDLSKAFDTITHEALGEAAEQAGLLLCCLTSATS